MRPVLAITMGDPAGIGPEICVKALSHEKLYDICVPVVIGDAIAMRDAIAFTNSTLKLSLIHHISEARGEKGTIDLVDVGALKPEDYQYGVVRAGCGEAAFRYIERGIQYALDGDAAAVVTGPINKEALHAAGHFFSGHTEIFAHFTNTSNYGMMLMGGGLRVIHCTTHVSMRQACDLITMDRVYNTIKLAGQALREIGLSGKKIGVAGFNAHSSENGLFGDEEARAIIPAIEKAQQEGINVEGPVPPDTVFVKALAGQYAIVVAMYHDQGHIPLKLIGFKLDPDTGLFTSMSGINTTIGLPIIRTSVDHGTAFDRAGKNIANEESLIDAIELAVDMAHNRAQGDS